eukprot:TRINITY_DN574_c0_g1_i19.p1 TRINITY_DN574_c0_g1~~TRINITY_DN574_c0_g1_i19.p1  ORF type:complete len:184 (+),score=13.63 TRINITY_DN574_c0_g1_i19:255-806(+)
MVTMKPVKLQDLEYTTLLNARQGVLQTPQARLLQSQLQNPQARLRSQLRNPREKLLQNQLRNPQAKLLQNADQTRQAPQAFHILHPVSQIAPPTIAPHPAPASMTMKMISVLSHQIAPKYGVAHSSRKIHSTKKNRKCNTSVRKKCQKKVLRKRCLPSCGLMLTMRFLSIFFSLDPARTELSK